MFLTFVENHETPYNLETQQLKNITASPFHFSEQLKLATKSLRGEHLILDTGKGCVMLALRHPVAASAPLVAAYGSLRNGKRKIENNTLGNFFNFFSVFYKDLG
jgi:hypothetical protein